MLVYSRLAMLFIRIYCLLNSLMLSKTLFIPNIALQYYELVFEFIEYRMYCEEKLILYF